ncbi:sigma-54 dependent transcriptional regulator [Cocleimonas sp. KMM 6892]|uniref:sigma-54-dependent transcriptional regulator n=1 Tax=unclassified Cocleimonas TaxID=2639732 RepID=UPI002DBC603D|nr:MULTISPECIES: sigma-54 dependent transcriptional regulator [unclassified Cocleimonas]MEB8432679.1 sigma-54 dependent transcriptional regulator [Cocleimonas sp. KMM 6892]MEC4715538.1 sigma-54 dependent transcriptional regulator [Cocleimonas sp. KMM 6895]MEC4744844.1 sigma-54 dependent transcriptional regulator [Cocleimonas sp. KMM 6896]
MIRCLIIDDEVQLAKSLSFTLRQSNIDCVEAYDGESGLSMVQSEKPDIILLDLKLPDMSGLEVLEQMLKINPDVSVIMISAHGQTKDAVSAMKLGAVDYLSKPFDVEELVLLINNTLTQKRLKKEVLYHRKKSTTSASLIGESPIMLDLLTNLEIVAKSKAKTVLLFGETGVGKTLVAKEIHNKSGNKDAPFVEINCSSLPEHLIEAELFGVEKGAYTGADSNRAGLVEVAENGTLFLDEIGEMPLLLQAKLLTFLESWKYRSVGSTREKKANIRVIAATNRNLQENVDNGTFRKDLYFRLNVIPIEIPALRQKRDDIWLLTSFFNQSLSSREGCNPLVMSDDIKKIFEEYNWPGNIRELKNIIERLTILYPGEKILPEWLPIDRQDIKKTSPDSIKEAMDDAERDLVRRALIECDGKKGLAAEKLGVSRHALKRRIQRLGL